MKIRNIFMAILSVLFVAVGCQEKEIPYSYDELQVSATTVMFDEKGGDQTLTVTSTVDWAFEEKALEGASWLTVEPTSGQAGETQVKMHVEPQGLESFDAELYIHFTNAAGIQEVQAIKVGQYVPVPNIPFKEGKYWFIFDSDGTEGDATVAMTTVPGAYGYADVVPTEKSGDFNVSTEANVFEFKKVDDKYTIQDVKGKYYSMKGTYDSFNIYDAPEEGSYWTIKSSVGGTWKITNAATGKRIQYSSSHSSVGAYKDARGPMPMLVNIKDAAPVAPPVAVDLSIADAMSQLKFANVSGVVAAVHAKGYILKDDSAFGFVYETAEEPKDFHVGDVVTSVVTPKIYNFGVKLESAEASKILTGSFEEPTAEKLDAAKIDSYAASIEGKDKDKDVVIKPVYVEIEGNLSKSDKNYNVAVAGTSKGQGSVKYALADQITFMDGHLDKAVKIKGYLVGISGGKYFNVIPVSIVESEKGPDPLIKLNCYYQSTVGEKGDIHMSINSNIPWTVQVPAGVTANPASGEANNHADVVFTVSETAANGELEIFFKGEGAQDTRFVILKQSPVEVKTVKEMLALPKGNTLYKVTGVVAGADGSSFSLVNGSDKIFVYKMNIWNGKDKTDQVVVDGNEITLVGCVDEFNGNKQIAKSALVSWKKGTAPEVVLPEGLTGDGKSVATAFTVADVIKISEAGKKVSNVWITGEIIGNYNNAILDTPKDDYNVVLGTTAAYMIVKVESDFRAEVGLKTNPTNLNKKISVKGNIDKYYGKPGLKGMTEFQWK